MPRRDGHRFARKESVHEDATPAHDAPTPTHVGRPATPQLLPPHYCLLPPLCRRFRAAFWDVSRVPGPRPCPYLSTLSHPGETGVLVLGGANRLCATVLLSGHPGTPGHAGVYRASSTASHAADHPQSNRGRGVADSTAQCEAPGHPRHALCDRTPCGRTLSVAGHRYRQRADGPAGAPRQRPTGSLCHALAETPPYVTAVLAAV